MLKKSDSTNIENIILNNVLCYQYFNSKLNEPLNIENIKFTNYYAYSIFFTAENKSG